MPTPAMKQFTITFKDRTAQTINVWEHETPECWLKELEPYFRIAGYVYSRDDVVSVTESEFGKVKRERIGTHAETRSTRRHE